MFTAQQHFIWAFDRLVEINAKPTVPALIEASGILRRLLLDQKPLVTQANKPKVAKVKFPVLDIATDLENDPMFNPGTLMLASHHGFAPELHTNWDYVKTFTMYDFLGLKKTFVMSKFLSVRDIIDHIANNAGGVHFSDPSKDTQEAVRDSYEGWVIGGIPALLSDLHAIIQSVMQGLAALYFKLSEPAK